MREIRREGAAIAAGALLVLIISLAASPGSAIAIAAGYLLGLFTVAMHLLVARGVSRFEGRRFFGWYYASIFIRLLIALVIYTALLQLGKIDQIPFTLSFIISYIFHSVIDIILIHKKYSEETYQNL